MSKKVSQNQIIRQFQEREKELKCLYGAQEILNNEENNTEDVLRGIIEIIPDGMQYPDICSVKITYKNHAYQSPNFTETDWVLSSNIVVQDEVVGNLGVYYNEERPLDFAGPFLKEEQQLIESISKFIGIHFFHKNLEAELKKTKDNKGKNRSEWGVILDMLNNTNPKLLVKISRKMVNYLIGKGIAEAEKLFDFFGPDPDSKEGGLYKEANFPYQAKNAADSLIMSNQVFEFTSKHLSEQEIITKIGIWIKEDQSGFLVNVINNPNSTFEEISNVLERYYHLKNQGLVLTPLREKSLSTALISNLLSSRKEYIKIAKRFIKLYDFHKLMENIIFPENSNGKLGGKGAGLFLSKNILLKSEFSNDLTRRFKIPKTWYIMSDELLDFMHYNNLEDIVEQKFKDIKEIRKEYPFISHVFKNASFSSNINKKLSVMLDDFGDRPLIVRSSSLLEDSYNAIFAGKYKSLFISNQGSKSERLAALTDAIAEVYASVFGPDPIEYRIERDLIDMHEEMGIMIQEVVGSKVGKYFFPAFAGVIFSHNNYRWSPRIKKEDGLVRVVPGLGTRAVDRLSDDYPVLIAPGEPKLKANVTAEETIRYSPKSLDVINLENRSFETLKMEDLLKEYGMDYPGISKVVSVISDQHIQEVNRFGMDFKKDSYVVTFNGLINNTDFIEQINAMLLLLQKEYGYPVDIEFAHTGKELCLLQCRPQSFGKVGKPAEIPDKILKEKLIFSAEKHITDGTVKNVTHIVYVDPQKYSEISNYEELISVGRAIGKLNKLLPKRQFILMGPGRWGSRGDSKLGVSVTYSEINNTSVLIEIARKRNEYVPEVSFGTHFFQDLVEANIFYLPLYPDDIGIVFNEAFFENSSNSFSELLPNLSSLSKIIKVIDIGLNTDGKVLDILMNSQVKKAVAILT
jgi:pyruvate,water dikinase